MNNHTAYTLAREKTPQQFMENPVIHWDAIVWIQRPLALWIVELLFALVGLCEALLVAYLTYKGNLWQQIISFYFILEMVNTIPYLLTVFFYLFFFFFYSMFNLTVNRVISSIAIKGVLFSVATPLHPRLPQLLARKKGTRKHVCKYIAAAAVHPNQSLMPSPGRRLLFFLIPLNRGSTFVLTLLHMARPSTLFSSEQQQQHSRT